MNQPQIFSPRNLSYLAKQEAVPAKVWLETVMQATTLEQGSNHVRCFPVIPFVAESDYSMVCSAATMNFSVIILSNYFSINQIIEKCVVLHTNKLATTEA